MEEKNRILFHRNCFLVLQYFKLITPKIVLLQRTFEKNLELYVITVLLTGQASMTISSPGKADKVSKVENDIGEAANESDAADGLHMNHQNHVKEVNALKETSSTGDQTATSSGESNNFYSTTITCVKSVKAFLEAYRVCVA